MKARKTKPRKPRKPPTVSLEKTPQTTEQLREKGRLPLFNNVSAAAAAELTDALRSEGSRLIPPDPRRLAFGTVESVRDSLDKIDATIVSVLCDLAGNPDLSDTCREMALIARESYIVRSYLPKPAESDGAE